MQQKMFSFRQQDAGSTVTQDVPWEQRSAEEHDLVWPRAPMATGLVATVVAERQGAAPYSAFRLIASTTKVVANPATRLTASSPRRWSRHESPLPHP